MRTTSFNKAHNILTAGTIRGTGKTYLLLDDRHPNTNAVSHYSDVLVLIIVN